MADDGNFDMRAYLPEFARKVSLAGLPGWQIYERVTPEKKAK